MIKKMVVEVKTLERFLFHEKPPILKALLLILETWESCGCSLRNVCKI